MKYHNELTRGEQAVIDKLTQSRILTVNQLAGALNSTPASIKVMVSNLRRKGFAISGGGKGSASFGYSLQVPQGRGISLAEREAMIADLKKWPLISHADIAKKYDRSPTTVARVARSAGLGRHATRKAAV